MSGRVAVIDIGKTNAKLALVDLETLTETAVEKTANTVLRHGPYPHYDIDRLLDFILDGLSRLARQERIEAISVTTHGATAALLDAAGDLAMPILDYEHPGIEVLAADYDLVRPDFAESGSPRLPIGLNLGAQIFWQQRVFPEPFREVASIVTYPQFWSYLLTGVAATEATSLGCHTDLWNPARRDFSSMVDALGWRRLFAPVRGAREQLGPVRPEICTRTGIAEGTPVYCGIHDSNASLYPHILFGEPPLSVVSTGTWVIAMSVGGRDVALDPARDTLINVNALGEPVRSARFMGGRENELLTGDLEGGSTAADAAAVLEGGIMLLPSVVQGSGPFPQRNAEWHPARPASPGAQRTAASFYLSMMTATCLELCGAEGPIIVEGPFAANELFARMLAAATGRAVFADAAGTGTSIGAALLADGVRQPHRQGRAIQSPGPQWELYARAWRERAGA